MFVSVNVYAAPPLWHGVFSASAIGGKLSIASLPKTDHITTYRCIWQNDWCIALALFWFLMCKCCAFSILVCVIVCVYLQFDSRCNVENNRLKIEMNEKKSLQAEHTQNDYRNFSLAQIENKTMADDVDKTN